VDASCTTAHVTIYLNYKDKIEKIKSILGCWKLRRLGLLGKITVLKSLIASQLVYIFSPLQTNHTAIKEINVMFYNLLWNDKGNKIKRMVMIIDYSEGRLDSEKIISDYHFRSSPLWYNSLIRVENRPVFFKEWFLKRVTKVEHLMDNSGKFLSLTAFQTIHDLTADL